MKHLFTFRQRPNESLTGKLARVSSNTRSRVSSDTLSQVSNKCRLTVGRLSTLFLLLLLSFGFTQQAWAYTINGSSLVFSQNETITFDFTGISGMDKPDVRGGVQGSFSSQGNGIWTFTFSQNQTINSGDTWFHYQTNCSGWEWQHGGVEDFKLVTHIPLPTSNTQTTIYVKDNGTCNGMPTFTWSTGGGGGDTGDCDNCGNVTLNNGVAQQ